MSLCIAIRLFLLHLIILFLLLISPIIGRIFLFIRIILLSGFVFSPMPPHVDGGEEPKNQTPKGVRGWRKEENAFSLPERSALHSTVQYLAPKGAAEG